MFQEIDQPGIGTFLAAGPALDFAAAPRDEVRPAPLLGQHTDEVLADLLGLGSGKIGELHDARIVAGPESG
jgi:2-methylfumaryl-CoA isomerase